MAVWNDQDYEDSQVEFDICGVKLKWHSQVYKLAGSCWPGLLFQNSIISTYLFSWKRLEYFKHGQEKSIHVKFNLACMFFSLRKIWMNQIRMSSLVTKEYEKIRKLVCKSNSHETNISGLFWNSAGVKNASVKYPGTKDTA